MGHGSGDGIQLRGRRIQILRSEVQAMVRSEDAQLAEKLLNKDWTGFARLHNGPSYWQNATISSSPNNFSALPAAHFPI
jgi:hypothetical protein